MKKIISIALVSIVSLAAFSQEKSITKGLRITKSVSIKSQVYRIDAFDSLNKSIILIEGNNITIDFKNATLRGSNAKKSPDEFFGVAILIQNSKNITVKNLKIKGYKIALLARNTEGLVLDNCDLSYNYRQHLNSTQEKEDLSDWMSYHQNENDQWLRYGAAIYLRNCNKAIIKNCKVTGGQNSLMMMECNDAMIYNNDFSFNSGIGIGMYKCSNNKIMYNRLVFNVRGYSDGVYNRGQDSAGILVYEQSNNNLFYKNNVTHSGDGFFLWAGQTTMDNGQGGCNGNIIAGNDFSYAPTNGVEVTFSRNTITDNRIFECDNGIWGGYSYETNISNNKFRNNKRAIAIEHGQNNKISYNIFYGDKKAIQLWGRAEQPSDWGYAKYRDTKSHNYVIASNNFNGNETVLDLNRTDSLNIFGNIYSRYGTLLKTDSTVTNLDTAAYDELSIELSKDNEMKIPEVDKPANPFKNVSVLAGKKNILITEWGPHDFRSPIIWNTNPTDTSGVMKFDILGPKGKWVIKNRRGVKNISSTNGEFPASITAEALKCKRTDILLELEYKGEAITTGPGNVIAKGNRYLFSYKKFFQPVQWTVKFFSLDTSSFNPIKTNQLFASNVRMRPIKSDTVISLDYSWWNGIKASDSSCSQFISVAEGDADFIKGNYEISVTWDDAVRLYVDNKLVLDEWNPALHKFDESPNKKLRIALGGKHSFRVEHLNLGGLGVLALKFKPVR
ncbi:MAG: right-handed parallel beta-helix repeat-containing protein [Bacteroidota bacterium]